MKKCDGIPIYVKMEVGEGYVIPFIPLTKRGFMMDMAALCHFAFHPKEFKQERIPRGLLITRIK